jgi:hypothetical protein
VIFVVDTVAPCSRQPWSIERCRELTDLNL